MAEIIKNVSNQITNFWAKFTRKQKITFIVLMTLVVIISIITVSILSKKSYAVLYTGLNSSEAGEIYNKLVEGKYDVKTQGNGTILVPEDQEETIRMQLAAEGYPKSGFNYDIFEKSTGFGATEADKQKYFWLQIQERLQGTIKSLEMVEDAIVNLTIPDNSSVVLKGDKQPATASVVLKIKNNSQITSNQVKAIVELVAKSVPGLTADNIAVIDTNWNILNVSNNDSNGYAGTQQELEAAVRDRLYRQVLNLLEPIFGFGKVVAGVNVDLDFEKKTTESIKFEPVLDDEGIAISMTELKETTKKNSANGGNPGQDPNGGAPQYPATEDDETIYEKISKTVNYEVNQTKELIEKEQGQIKDLSVSVVVDSKEPNEEILSQVKEIIAGAVGIDKSLVVVQSMPFNGRSSLEDMFDDKSASASLFKTENLILYILLGLLLVGLTIVAAKLFKKPVEVYQGAPIQEGAVASAAAGSQTTASVFEVEEIPDISVDADRHTYKEQIAKYCKKNPETVVQLIRNWLNED